MDLRHLRTFAAIADAGGYARAAVRLHLSQPALSRQIHVLERDLGVRLFDRLGRRVQLTSEGEDLLRRIRRLLTEVDALGERARALKGGHTGVLRVGATPQNIEGLLAGFLTRYRRRHPGIEVHLVEDGAVGLQGRLERGEVQLAIIEAGVPQFSHRLLFPISLVAVTSPARRLSRRGVLEFAELADEPLLILRRDFGSRAWFDAACQITRVRPTVLLESSAPETLIALAGAGYGVAVVPSNVRMPARSVRAIPIVQQGSPIGRWVSISWDPRRLVAPYAAQFVEELAKSTQGTYPGRALTGAAPLPRPPSR
jgi:LysR family transcriptional regulator, cyn operon transcriptional activator